MYHRTRYRQDFFHTSELQIQQYKLRKTYINESYGYSLLCLYFSCLLGVKTKHLR